MLKSIRSNNKYIIFYYSSFGTQGCPDCSNQCKKVTGKKSLKKPGNKTFGKKSKFSKVLGRNITGKSPEFF